MEIDTIAAIATPIGSSGIGIVRISGSDAFEILKRIFSPSPSPASSSAAFFGNIKSHRLYYGFIRECKDNRNIIIDEVLMVLMRSPRSYTREDVVEIQSHSGSVVLSKILQLAVDNGSRLAEPGEFTKRAFLNGRIDLTQAESIAEMISAKTESGLNLAAIHLTGSFKNKIHFLIEALTKAQVELEAGIEFPEEVCDSEQVNQIADRLKREVLNPIRLLLQNYDDGHVLRDGIRLDIVGRPNVGKSSLLNSLIKKEKAIVTDLPGTTRDLIEDYTSIEGIPILITDTAGIHSTKDPVEIIGIQKTKENIQRSDLVLLVIDGACGFTDEDYNVFGQISHRNALLIINKIDLISEVDKIVIPESFKSLECVFVSAKSGSGLADMKGKIKNKCLNEVDIEPGRSLVPNLRQKAALESAAKNLEESILSLSEGCPEELIVADLVAARNALGLITGDKISTDVLDNIFNKFCIGK